MAAPMKSPVAIFLLVIAALALLVGLPRAAVEFGHRGLVAYAQLVLSPAVLVVVVYLWIVPLPGSNGLRFLPTRNIAINIGWGLLVVTTGLMVAAAVLGVGWLAR